METIIVAVLAFVFTFFIAYNMIKMYRVNKKLQAERSREKELRNKKRSDKSSGFPDTWEE